MKKFIDDFDVVVEAVIVEAVRLAKAAKRNTVMQADMAATSVICTVPSPRRGNLNC